MANNYHFPLGIGSNVASGQPYMLLTSYESKNAIESVGQGGHASGANPGIAKSSIALYIPPNALKTQFAATYEESAGAATKAGMGSALGRMNLNAFRPGADPGNIMATLFSGVTGGLQVAGGAMAAQIDKGTGMLAAQGIAVNNHMELTYKGPSKFRTHDFAFNFFPKNKNEAEEIRKILKDLENGMLPRMGGGVERVKGRTLSQPFFQAPRHWTIDFFTHGSENAYLFQIKKSVITAMNVNHDPNSTVSLHEGTGSPVQTTLALTFKEIELVVSGDKGMDISGEVEAAARQADNAERQRKAAAQGGPPSDYRLKNNITLLQE